MDAVVPAAGQGTRLHPLTDDKPKPLVEIADRPLLTHVFDAVVPADPASITVVVGYCGDQIVERFGDTYRDIPIEYARQERQRGLAHAVLQAESTTDEDVLICNGDNILSKPLDAFYGAHTETGTMLVERVTEQRATTTGVVQTDEHDRVARVVEKPENPPSRLVSAGAFVFSRAIFDACRAIEPSSRGEYELADAITHLLDQGGSVDVHSYRGRRINVNRPTDIEQAEKLLRSS